MTRFTLYANINYALATRRRKEVSMQVTHLPARGRLVTRANLRQRCAETTKECPESDWLDLRPLLAMLGRMIVYFGIGFVCVVAVIVAVVNR